FQAEDGIRDFHVTGVQTCALPILMKRSRGTSARRTTFEARSEPSRPSTAPFGIPNPSLTGVMARPESRSIWSGFDRPTCGGSARSEERRVGKGGKDWRTDDE